MVTGFVDRIVKAFRRDHGTSVERFIDRLAADPEAREQEAIRLEQLAAEARHALTVARSAEASGRSTRKLRKAVSGASEGLRLISARLMMIEGLRTGRLRRAPETGAWTADEELVAKWLPRLLRASEGTP